MKKEKISNKQFLLVINGPSCGGKSEIAKVIMEQYGGIYNGKSDTIKWLISDYDSDVHREIVHEMTLATVRIAFNHGLSVLKEGGLFEYEKLAQSAKEVNIPLFVVNVEAPDVVLKKRFLDRVEAKKGGARIANVDPKRFEKLNEMYISTKIESPLEFDSSKQKPEEITELIVEYLRKKLEI